jgi:hypothetical protein
LHRPFSDGPLGVRSTNHHLPIDVPVARIGCNANCSDTRFRIVSTRPRCQILPPTSTLPLTALASASVTRKMGRLRRQRRLFLAVYVFQHCISFLGPPPGVSASWCVYACPEESAPPTPATQLPCSRSTASGSFTSPPFLRPPLSTMSGTEHHRDDEQPRVFPLVLENTGNLVSQEELHPEPNVVPAIDDSQRVDDVQLGEAVQQVEDQGSSGPGNNDVEADDFLRPREVILAREAIRIRHGSGLSPYQRIWSPADMAQDVRAA